MFFALFSARSMSMSGCSAVLVGQEAEVLSEWKRKRDKTKTPGGEDSVASGWRRRFREAPFSASVSSASPRPHSFFQTHFNHTLRRRHSGQHNSSARPASLRNRIHRHLTQHESFAVFRKLTATPRRDTTCFAWSMRSSRLSLWTHQLRVTLINSNITRWSSHGRTVRLLPPGQQRPSWQDKAMDRTSSLHVLSWFERTMTFLALQ